MRTSVIKRNCANFLTVLSLVLSATAFDAQALALEIEVRGSRSCGDWVSTRPVRSIETIAVETWLVGYLSGLAIGTNKDFIKGTDNPSIFLWVDNYCRANPLKSLGDAGTDLYFELIKQKKL